MWESKKQENCLGMSGTVSSEGMAGGEERKKEYVLL